LLIDSYFKITILVTSNNKVIKICAGNPSTKTNITCGFWEIFIKYQAIIGIALYIRAIYFHLQVIPSTCS